jgi:hypothetical protein|tara:strand:+ start:313 stop:561 length:249 start_codon:yes stop_codon:yes gene_type:complete
MSQDSIYGIVLSSIAALLIAAACFPSPSPFGKSISREIGKMQKHKSQKIGDRSNHFRKRDVYYRNFERSESEKKNGSDKFEL